MIPLSPDPETSLKYHLQDMLKDEILVNDILELVESHIANIELSKDELDEAYQEGYNEGVGVRGEEDYTQGYDDGCAETERLLGDKYNDGYREGFDDGVASVSKNE